MSSLTISDKRDAFRSLLNAPEISRAPNLKRLLQYIEDMYFSGREDEIKEYQLGVAALGRPQSFDPQNDPIVRVSAYNLRKRMESFYRREGAGLPVRVVLPVGGYVPDFVAHALDSRTGERGADPAPTPSVAPDTAATGVDDLAAAEALPAAAEPAERSSAPLDSATAPFPRLLDPAPHAHGFSFNWPAALVPSRELAVALVPLLMLVLFLGWRSLRVPAVRGWRANMARSSATPGAHSLQPTPASPSTAAFGPAQGIFLTFADGVSYRDKAGALWRPENHCSGGKTFHHQAMIIGGTADSALFESGRSGNFTCAIAVPPGSYEVHLLFADTSGDHEAWNRNKVSVNGGPAYAWDIVDQAGGDNRAITKVLTGVRPEADGSIHFAFSGDHSFVNAAALYPAAGTRMRPLRLTASPAPVQDRDGHVWMPDQYYFGGSHVARIFPTYSSLDPRLFQWEHYGNFRYVLPVAAGQLYTVRLFFSEGYFGPTKYIAGGPGSRYFDVFLNGSRVLHNFDILREATPQQEAVVKTFRHIAPTALDTIEMRFMPVHDYPLVNAIEVTSEGTQKQRESTTNGASVVSRAGGRR